MKFIVDKTPIEDLLVVTPEVFEDQRGFFLEVYRKDIFEAEGLPTGFVQLNHSGSVRNTVRGLHFQWQPQMGKLMRVTKGTAFLVAVDIRKGSPTLGQWYGVTVSESDRRLVWAPAGFARGFAVVSDFAEIQYLCTGIYNPKGEGGVRWNDPAIGVKWPIDGEPVLSGKDATAQTLAEWLAKPESDTFTK